MRKIMKSIRSGIMKIIPCILTALMLAFSPVASLTTAYAAPAVIPVSAELIGELLVALGLMAGNATDGYVWTANDNPYVSSIFEEQVSGITNGVPVSTETLGKLYDTVIPADVYNTDGTNFYVASKPLTTSDIFLRAQSIAGISYGVPTNIIGAQAFVQVEKYLNGVVVRTPVSDLGKDYYYIPYFVGESGSTYILQQALYFGASSCFVQDIYRPEYRISGATYTSMLPYVLCPTKLGHSYTSSEARDITGSTVRLDLGYVHDLTDGWKGYLTVSGSGADRSGSGIDAWQVNSGTLLQTKGFPVLTVEGDKQSLGNAVVKYEPPKDDDNDNNTPPVPQSPNGWEIWKGIEDLVKFIDSGEPSNGGTDYGQYVNNNYNYVSVDINVPDQINNNVNVSGGLDINGSGNVDITIHEDISLPSAGDGSGFYNPDAADVIGALTKDNPVIGTVSGLFAAIDPALVGIFSVSVSLTIVLGLWKLIRG